MKKTITILFSLIFMLSIVAFATDEIVESETSNTGVIGQADVKIDGTLPFTTVIDGYMCSESANWNYRTEHGGDFYIKSTDNPFCHTNTKHQGEVWIVWKPDSSGRYIKLADPRLSLGAKYCVDGISAGTKLDYSYYYCDDAVTTCLPSEYYPAGCDYQECNVGEVLIRRSVKELTSGGCDDYTTEQCWEDGDFNFNCDGADQTGTVTGGTDGSGDGVESTNLRGEWYNIGLPNYVKPGEKFEIRATFKALEAGTYYLEAGMLEGGFAYAVEGSRCDGSVNFAGDSFILKKDETIDILFKPVARTKEARYNVIIGAYTGCLDEGGEKVNTLTQIVTVTSGEKPLPIPVTSGINWLLAGGIGVAILIVLLILLAVWWFFLR